MICFSDWIFAVRHLLDLRRSHSRFMALLIIFLNLYLGWISMLSSLGLLESTPLGLWIRRYAASGYTADIGIKRYRGVAPRTS